MSNENQETRPSVEARLSSQEHGPRPTQPTGGRVSVFEDTIMERGWIRLWRKLTDSQVWSTGIEMRSLWITMLLRANHAEGWFKGTLLQPGQFAASFNTLAEDSLLTMMQVRTCIQKLEEWQKITRKVTSNYQVITICNWELYQCGELWDNTVDNNQITTEQQASNKRVTTNKNNKNNKNDKNTSSGLPSKSGDSQPLALKANSSTLQEGSAPPPKEVKFSQAGIRFAVNLLSVKGVYAHGRVGKALKSCLQHYPESAVLEGFELYIQAEMKNEAGKYLSPEAFAADIKRWVYEPTPPPLTAEERLRKAKAEELRKQEEAKKRDEQDSKAAEVMAGIRARDEERRLAMLGSPAE